MTSPSSEARTLTSSIACWPCLSLWLVVILSSSDVRAARSLSVLDSKLLQLYQKYRQPYDVFEPGFAADPDGYEVRNALQPSYSGDKTSKDGHDDTFKAGPGHYDDGYHTRTVPYHHDTGGYATQNAFQPHYSDGTHNYREDDGYHTKTVGFPLYQEYQPLHIPEPTGYATRTVYHPYRSGKQHTKLAPTVGPAKHHSDDGYHTRTAELIPLYQDYHHYDPGGYATQNVFQPYRSAVDVGGPRRKHGYETRADDDREYVDDRTLHEDRFVHKKLYSSDDIDDGRRRYVNKYSHNDDDNDDDDDDDRRRYVSKYSNDDDDDDDDHWSTQRPPPAATTDYSYSTNIFVHKPTEGWRSAVGRRPHIGLHLPSSTVTSSTRPAAPRYSKLEITIDRFGQEEDVTGASFAEPISYESERDAGRSSSPSSSSSSSSRQIHVSRRLSKQSDTARLGNIISKFTQQSTVADRRSLNIDPCMSLPDGDYPLDERFVALLPDVNARCNFIKCAHKSAFVNACSAGTRNPDHNLALDAADPLSTGAHYCSVRDVDDYCEHHYYHPPHSINDEHDLNRSDYDLLQPNVKHYYVV